MENHPGLKKEFKISYRVSNNLGEVDFTVGVFEEEERYYVKNWSYPGELIISGNRKGYSSLDEADSLAREIAKSEISKRSA